MSFFADIIADSRRKTRPTYRPGHRSEFLSGSLPVDIHAPKPFVSDPVKDGSIASAENPDNATEIAKPDTTPTAPISAPTVSSAAEKNVPVLKNSVSSEHVLAHGVTADRLNTPAAPVVQLKAENNSQDKTTSPKLGGNAGTDINMGHDAIATSVAPIPEKPFTSPQTALQKKHARKHDDVVQVPATSAKFPHIARPESTIDQSDMALEDTDSDITGAQLRQEKNSQRAETSVASDVMVGVQVESPATHTRQMKSPVGGIGQSNDASSKKPRVQIGQVNVVIEQVVAPRRRAGAVAGNDDYASRNFLKSL